MLQTIIRKLGKKKRKEKIMMWTLIWLNKSVAIINATLQLLDIYRYRLKIKSIK